MTLSVVPVDDGRELNLAVIGTGRWGQTLMHVISAKTGVALAAVVSSKQASSTVGDTPVPVFPTWQATVSVLPIDGFVLAVPPDIQPTIAEQIISAGIPVFLEKPLALDRDAAARILAAAKSSGFSGVVDHIHLFASEFGELCRRLPSDRHGWAIEAVSGNKGPYRDRWTSCWDWAPHDIAMCLAVMETAPKTVSARISTSIKQNGREFENYEIALDFGARGHASITTGNAFDGPCRKFVVKTADTTLTYAESRDRVRSLNVERGGRAEAVNIRSIPPLDAALTVFAQRVRRKSDGIEDIERGALIVNICEAIHESVSCDVPVPVIGP